MKIKINFVLQRNVFKNIIFIIKVFFINPCFDKIIIQNFRDLKLLFL